MKTNLNRWVLMLTILAFSVSSVFAQEEAASPDISLGLMVGIILLGVLAILGLGFAMNVRQVNEEKKSE